MRRHLLLVCLAVGALVGGCAHAPLADPIHGGPFYVPQNHAGESTLGGLRRVVLLPVAGGTTAPEETAASLDPVMVAALQRQNRFEVVTLTRDDCQRKFRVPELSSTAALPHDFLETLKRDFAADGVIFVDITVFHGYRPLALGLRGKLASLDGKKLIWTFDNVFSADEPAVANAARHFYLGSDRGGIPIDLTPGVLESPVRFAGYAAAAMFTTLPPVHLPPPPDHSR